MITESNDQPRSFFRPRIVPSKNDRNIIAESSCRGIFIKTSDPKSKVLSSMHLVYIDESYDADGFAFAALLVPEAEWRSCFSALAHFRTAIKNSDGIYVRKELHARDFVAGRGNISQNLISKFRRCQIFDQALQYLTSLPVRVISACDKNGKELRLYERFLNRINTTMKTKASHAVLICDSGNEYFYTKLRRKLGRFNPIPSRFGVWQDTGGMTKNIPLDWILEDPLFKDSATSTFIQMADFIAFALLRQEFPVASRNKYGIDKSFRLLEKICVREAFSKDPKRLGIIRA